MENITTQDELMQECIKEIDSLGEYAFKGVINEIVDKYKGFGLKGVFLKEVRAYIKSVFRSG